MGALTFDGVLVLKDRPETELAALVKAAEQHVLEQLQLDLRVSFATKSLAPTPEDLAWLGQEEVEVSRVGFARQPCP